MSRRDKRRELPPLAIQVLGGVLLVAFAAIWFFTDRVNTELVGAAMALLFSGHLFRISIGQENREKEAVREALEAYEEAKRASGEGG